MLTNLHKHSGNRFSEIRKGMTQLLLLGLILLNVSIFAQESGSVVGRLVDADNGDPLIGANVMLENTILGSATDIDGMFTIINVPAGTYTLVVSYVGYQETRITDIKVKANESYKLDLGVKSQTIEGEEVVVEARMIENTGAAMLKKRQRSDAVSDGVSSEEFSRSGSGDAAEAIKQVVGASVVDGKYVYVRGLGDRYSSTQLNGVELPSSDPDKKAFQLDLLPTNLLDNITTIKTFTPDKPGNFSGGIVDVATKTFPDEQTLKLSYSSSMSSTASFNDNFLSYNGGGQDWLAKDDGARALPTSIENGTLGADGFPSRTQIRQDLRFGTGDVAANAEQIGKSFSETMNVKRQSVPLNQGLGLSYGNKMALGGSSSLGYQGSLTYNRSYSFYDEGEVGIYSANAQSDELIPQLIQTDAQGTEEASIGALGTFSFNLTNAQQIGGTAFYSRNGTSKTRSMTGKWPQELGDGDERIVNNRVLEYQQRDILSLQLYGRHNFSGLNNASIEWKASSAATSQDEPDRRLIFFIYDSSNTVAPYTITGSNFDDPSRYFRNVEDDSRNVNLDFSMPFGTGTSQAKLKLGGAYQTKDREARERIFSYDTDDKLLNAVNGDLDLFFNHSNFEYSLDSTRFGLPVSGNVIFDNSKDKNQYDAEENIAAGYAMVDFPFTSKMRFVGGVRYETTEISVVSQDSTLDRGNIDEQDWLPSANLVYQLTSNMNLRLAATQTLARPNFREIAPYSTKEFVGGFEFAGNPNLKRTLIQNYDLRWEWFKRPGEIIAVSGFYKKMKDPIERTFPEGVTASNRIETLENVGEATLYGIELETRVNMDFVAPKLRNFSVGGNLSLVQSTVNVPDVELANRRSLDPNADDTRPLQGQSPYIFNIDFTYGNLMSGTTASLSFNTYGERLAKVSRNFTPDVYEQPFNRLNFTLSQRILQQVSAKFAVKNILNSAYEETYNFNGSQTVYRKYKQGTGFSLGISYEM